MTGDPSQVTQLPRRRSFGRISLALLLGLVAGWASWSWLGTFFEVPPLYQIKNPRGIYYRPLGPWLSSSERRENGAQAIDTFRLLATGQLVGQYEQSLLATCQFMHVIDHPELGKDTLVGVNRNNRQQYALLLYQPRTGENRVVRGWNSTTIYLEISNSGRYYLERRTLPLTPLLGWGITGMPDTIRADFYEYLGFGGYLHAASSVALIRIYSTLDGSLLGECALPGQSCVFASTRLLDDGEHLAIFFRPYSGKLSQYFLAKTRPDEDQTRLASIIPGLMLMNFRTGRIIKEWPDLGDCSLDHVTNQMWLHRWNNVPPLMHWASSRPDKVEFRLLDTQSRKLFDLERPEHHHVEETKQAPTGYQMFSWHCDLDAQQRRTQTTLLCTTFDSTGKILSKSTLKVDGSAQGQLITNQRQLIVSQDIIQPWHQSWFSLTQRWPWLKKLHNSYACHYYVWDVDTNEKHLVTTSRVNMFEASPDGHFLLVGKGTDDRTEELKVYALPFLPRAWWTLWLPRLAGLLTTLLIFSICLLGFSRQKKQSDSRHTLKST
ncbi:MAG: hypothetical protein QM703_19725 [Gemmatales bacterium]